MCGTHTRARCDSSLVATSRAVRHMLLSSVLQEYTLQYHSGVSGPAPQPGLDTTLAQSMHAGSFATINLLNRASCPSLAAALTTRYVADEAPGMLQQHAMCGFVKHVASRGN